MAVDRGGLNYPITVSYDNSPIAQFRADIAQVKADWAALKAQLAAAKGAVGLPAIGGAVGGGGAAGGLAGLAAPPPPSTTTAWQKFFKVLDGGSNDANKSANFLINTFERLFLRVVIVGAIRKAASEFAAFVGEMITFNASVETATLGISSLLLALGHMKDATGADTNSVRSFTLANAEASKQIALLRVDALKSASTFENLVKTYQTAIAPGLQAGLNLDEIRKLTLQISQAGAAIGMPQNQLAEEIRSLLQGTINVRNTKIATALGISNEDIRQAKEMGNLVQFLTQKFNAFDTAGEAALGTFNIILTNLKDGFAVVIGMGGEQFFKRIEGIFQNIQSSLGSINKEKGIFEPNPKAVFIIQQVADVISSVVDDMVRLVSGFGWQGILNTAQAFIGTLRLGFQVVFGIVNGISNTIKDVGGALVLVKDAISNAFGLDIVKSMNIASFVAFLVEIKALMFLFGTLIGVILGTFQTLLGVVTAIGGKMALTLGAAYIMAEVIRQWSEHLSGVQTSFKALGEEIKNNLTFVVLFIKESFIIAFNNIWAIIKIGFFAISNFIQDIFSDIAVAGAKAVYKAIQAALAVANFLPGLFGKELSVTKDIMAAIAGAESDMMADKKRHSDERIANIARETKAIQDQNKASQKYVEDLIIKTADANDAAKQNNPVTTASSLLDLAKRSAEELRKAIGGLPDALGTFPTDIGQSKDDAITFSKTFEKLPGLMQPILESFKEQSKLIHDLTEEAIKGNKALTDGLQVLGLTGTVLQQRQNIFASEEKYREQSRTLTIDEKEQHQVLLGIIRQRAELEVKINNMSQDDINLISAATDMAEKDQKIREKLAELIEQELLLHKQKNALIAAGDSQGAEAADEEITRTHDLIEAQKEELLFVGKLTDGWLSNKTQTEAKTLTDAISNRVVLAGRQIIVEQQLQQIARDRLELQRQDNKIVNDKNQLLAAQQIVELKNQNQLNAIKANNDRNVFNTRYSLPEVTSLVTARDALTLLKAQVEQAQKLRQLALDQLNFVIARNELETLNLLNARDAETNALAKAKLTQQLNASLDYGNTAVKLRNELEEQGNIKLKEENLQLEQAAEKAQHARDIIEKPISTGVLDGIRKAAQELPSLYQSTVDVIKNIVTGLTDFIAQSIVDAFDPTKKEDIAQRFGQLLQQIAKQVIEMFIHLALVKAILGLGFLGTGGVSGGGLPSSLATTFGYAEGGFIRPRGLDSRDTEPIWAQKGEFMQPVSAVMKYGGDVMEKIRRGMIDPYSLRTLAGMGRMTSPATANPFTPPAGQQQAMPHTSSAGQQAAPVQAFVVANDQHLDRLLAGGKNALFNFMEKNRGSIRGRLGL